jgi:hypothetical protein
MFCSLTPWLVQVSMLLGSHFNNNSFSFACFVTWLSRSSSKGPRRRGTSARARRRRRSAPWGAHVYCKLFVSTYARLTFESCGVAHGDRAGASVTPPTLQTGNGNASLKAKSVCTDKKHVLILKRSLSVFDKISEVECNDSTRDREARHHIREIWASTT